MSHPGATQAGYRARLIESLTLLCGDTPSDDLVDRWIAGDESHLDQPGWSTGNPAALDLQDWAASHAPFEWIMGITVIDAAEMMAENPRDGWEDEE